jgi:hypothetical protein
MNDITLLVSQVVLAAENLNQAITAYCEEHPELEEQLREVAQKMDRDATKRYQEYARRRLR